MASNKSSSGGGWSGLKARVSAWQRSNSKSRDVGVSIFENQRAVDRGSLGRIGNEGGVAKGLKRGFLKEKNGLITPTEKGQRLLDQTRAKRKRAFG